MNEQHHLRTPAAQPRPYVAYVLAQQQKARTRAGRQRALLCGNGVRSILAFGISLAPVPHWLGVTLFWVAAISLALAWRNLEEYNIARVQSTML